MKEEEEIRIQLNIICTLISFHDKTYCKQSQKYFQRASSAVFSKFYIVSRVNSLFFLYTFSNKLFNRLTIFFLYHLNSFS